MKSSPPPLAETWESPLAAMKTQKSLKKKKSPFVLGLNILGHCQLGDVLGEPGTF